MLVGGLTTNISPTLTNSFVWSYTRIWWRWASSAAPPQVAGLGGALEIGGETSSALIPYNVNNQNVRQRFWDGHDSQYKDDLTKIVGNHVIQFGGLFGRNFDYHARNDNGQGINTSPVYQIVNATGIPYSAANYPTNLPSSQVSNGRSITPRFSGSSISRRVGHPQRTQPDVESAGNAHVRQERDQLLQSLHHRFLAPQPTVTLTYGLGYQVEMPPVEQNGKQVELVDTNGNPVSFTNYFATKSQQALAGTRLQPDSRFFDHRQCHRREPHVSLQSVLRRRQPPCGGCLESEGQRHARKVGGRRQDRDPRGLWPDL